MVLLAYSFDSTDKFRRSLLCSPFWIKISWTGTVRLPNFLALSVMLGLKVGWMGWDFLGFSLDGSETNEESSLTF